MFKITERREKISINFSFGSKYFSILEVQQAADKIYLFEVGEGKAEDALSKLFDNIEKRNCKTVIQKDSFDSTTRLVWSSNSYDFAIINETTVTVRNASNLEAADIVYTSHDKAIKEIYGVGLSVEENGLKCSAVALFRDYSIGALDAENLKHGYVVPTRQIKNTQEPTDVVVCFSDDLKSVVISYNAMMTMIVEQEDRTFQQKVFHWLKKKKVVDSISWQGNNFIICAHNPFDQGYKIYFSAKETLKMKVKH